MKRILLCIALAASPLALASACATFEQITPASPRNALAQATVSFVGVTDLATVLYQRGALSADQVSVIIAKLQTVDAALTTAESLLSSGENALAATTLADAVASLDKLSIELYALARANPAKPAPVVVVAPPSI